MFDCVEGLTGTYLVRQGSPSYDHQVRRYLRDWGSWVSDELRNDIAPASEARSISCATGNRLELIDFGLVADPALRPPSHLC